MPQQNELHLHISREFCFVAIMLLSYVCYLCVFIIFGTNVISNDNSTDLEGLKLLHVISRHGARNPSFLYPNDPHKNYNFAGGLGQLTNRGKLEQYILGKFLKERYCNFLTSNPKESYSRSSAVDRTLESAMAVLAGLYPPEDNWVWNKNLIWQPIPVYSLPGKDDYLLHYNPDCPAFHREYSIYKKTSGIMQNYQRKYQDFFNLLSNETGVDIKEWYQVLFIHTTLEIERQNNLTMPHWVTEDVLEKLRINAALAFYFLYGTTTLQKLRGGPLIAEVINNIQRKLDGSLENKKIFLYNTHDAVLAAVMSALGIYNNEPPPFSATIIFELHSFKDQNFIRILYINSTTPVNYPQVLHLLHIPGCPVDCPVEKFIDLTKYVVPTNWKEECL